MEVIGTMRIFSRNIEKHGLRRAKYLGDDDSKSHLAVKSTYPGVEVEKHKCVGHVQKRVGTRLRNLKINVKNTGGTGKLTDKILDRLQNYYDIADLQSMTRAIHASIFDVSSSKENNWHVHCPDGESSWCAYQPDIETGQSRYKPGNGLPLSVIKHVESTFADLVNINSLALSSWTNSES